MLTKQEANKLMKIKGEARGIAIKFNLDYIRKKKGEEGLKKLENRMAELGFPLSYNEINKMGFYPIGTEALQFAIIEEMFNFSGKDFEEMGVAAVKIDLFTKILMSFFTSLKLVGEQVPKIWRKHYTVGDLEMFKFSEKERYVILRLKNFKIHPLFCISNKSYFSKVTEMVVKKPTKAQELKCMFRGDPYHEFLLTW